MANHPSSPPSTTSTSSSATPSATATAAPASSGAQLHNASIAGIATGLAAGAVAILLLTLYLQRRKRAGLYPFAPKRTSAAVFPESAWLYDPARTPKEGPASEQGSPHHTPNPSTAMLVPAQQQGETPVVPVRNARRYSPVPAPREGAVELGDSAPPSPSLLGVHARSTEPLLATSGLALTTDEAAAGDRRSQSGERGHSTSPSGRRGGGAGSSSGSPGPGRGRGRSFGGVRAVDGRPMSSIDEDTVSARQGLLQPPYRPDLRHSS
ncbi:hypothetical protein LTR08_007601 [Meristemomyces frigidus]|nr:hypothetical protein LTR08_007601 [Meristemomyces frigidus]